MLINVDVKSLEVFVVADLSGDKVLKEELLTPGYDMHSNNQTTFGLPDRVTAKRFVFKLIYGATAFGYANDPDFFTVSRNNKFWQKVIDSFYEKLIATAQRQQYLEIPSGTYYPMEPFFTEQGELKWPITRIKNYPVNCSGFLQ
jgi:DNA polymerase I-like protein with 3'-5' exonuclease and polymerase domains